MTINKQKFVTLAILATLALPVHASVRITEIMYDVPGSDSGREWIEIQNQSNTVFDASKLKLFEASVNHGLTVVRGSSVLQPGAVAVLVKDSTKFTANWPAFSGTVFKSSFSLSNTGETLVLKNGTSTVVEDTVTYSSSMGASGDGLSLHRVESVFVATTPDPGIVLPEYKAIVKKTSSSNGATAKKVAVTSRPSPVLGATDSVGTPAREYSATSVEYPLPRSSSDGSEFPLWEALAGLGILLVLAISGVWYVYVSETNNGAKKGSLSGDETLPSADEFEIK